MTLDPWSPVIQLLDDRAEAGDPARFWLRDDDAITQTDALLRLADLCGVAALPVLLAVIPAQADDRLATFVARSGDFAPCQHGWRHQNHAGAGQRACEIGGSRATEEVLAELAAGRHRLAALFSDRLEAVLVPPWNRIEDRVVDHLPRLGFTALSTFGPPSEEPGGIVRVNCDIDIVDWRHGRVGRSAPDITAKLAASLTAARHHRRPIGILTHHLAHDTQAWSVLGDMITRLARHPGATFVRAVESAQA